MKKTLYYSDRVKLENTFLGLIWLITGLLGFWDSLISLAMKVVTMIACSYTLFKVMKAQKENADEMAEQNINRAKAFASDYTQITYCVLAIVAMLFLHDVELSVDLGKIIPNITFICMGINHLVVGLAFRKFEEE